MRYIPKEIVKFRRRSLKTANPMQRCELAMLIRLKRSKEADLVDPSAAILSLYQAADLFHQYADKGDKR